MKLKFRPVSALFSALLLSAPISVANVSALSAAQSGAVSQHCASIKTSLKNLQKADSRTRVYLGSVYNTVLNNFITPLNLRLVRANSPDATLASTQSAFTSARDAFAKNFVSYSQSLEELISLDCTSDPAGFYQKLETTREKRADLESSVADLKTVIDAHLTAVVELDLEPDYEETE